MPLPYLTPEIQCTAKSKRSGVRCLRPRSLNWVGCTVCKMHGAGRNPANFTQQGRESRTARAERKRKMAELAELARHCKTVGIFLPT
jgi:hypothetical protein